MIKFSALATKKINLRFNDICNGLPNSKIIELVVFVSSIFFTYLSIFDA